MKVIQINTQDIGGGAEKVAYQITNELSKKGIQCNLLVGKKIGNNDNCYDLKLSFFERAYSKAIREIFSLQGSFSHSVSKRVLDKVKNYDIVNYHNLHGNYFNIKDVKRIAEEIPTVWTLHDMWAFTGRCSFAYDCDGWIYNCGKCGDKLKNHPSMNFDNSRYVLNLKKKNFTNKNIHIVTPSKWLKNLAEKSILKDLDIRTIHNGVDIDTFIYNNKSELRNKYGLDINKKYILFISADINDPRKGFRHLVNVLNKLKNKQNIVLLVAGKLFDESQLENEFMIRQFGYITDEKDLNEIYSLADIFVMPTLSENFPCTIIECMASGTPVVSFNVGGISEQITDETGWLVEKGNEKELQSVIERALNDDKMLKNYSINARNRVVEKFSLQTCVDNYFNLYKEILSDQYLI
ncbi:glycosyltransferase [Clostridium thermarum]|uniref:glycosyltransferase n=1 Tax=Clostridium thermarum TaxID=1716543 RepID=UPI00111D9D01|nr:glycosyltransferase [Clostridium thermarum]